MFPAHSATKYNSLESRKEPLAVWILWGKWNIEAFTQLLNKFCYFKVKDIENDTKVVIQNTDV